MASIGEVVSTPQGLAVVVQVLPTQFKDGSQILSQVVVSPLTGGPAPFVPLPPLGPPVFNPQIQAQAAALFVSAVIDARDPTANVPGAIPPPAPRSVPSIPGGIPAPVAFASAAGAYQATVDRSTHTGPTITVTG